MRCDSRRSGDRSCDTEADYVGDCTGRIEFRGVTYRPHNLLPTAPRVASRESDRGDVVGCDGEPVDQVAVHKIRGVATELAIAVIGDSWSGVYAREGTGPMDWPINLQGTSPQR